MIRFLRIYLQEHMEYLLDYKSIFQWPKAKYGQEIHIFPIYFSNSVFSIQLQFIHCNYSGAISGGHLSVYDITLEQFLCSSSPSENFRWDDRYTICIGY